MTELEIATQQLTDVRTAITAVLTGPGQSYTLLGRQFTKAELSELRSMEKDLIARVGRLTRGGVKVQRAVML
jgi:hypothetical protein